jgi:hypothetical protein
VATVAEALQDQVARTLTSTETVTTLHEGTRVVQSDATRNLTAADTDANWTVATGANGVRAFVVTPTDVRGNLLTLDPTTDSTRIEVTGAGGNTWRLHVYEEAATGQHYLAVKNGSGSLTDRPCGGIDMGEPIDLSAGTVDGADCPALSFAEGTTAPWTVSVVYGNHTDANYTVTLNTTTAESEVAGPAAGTSPRWEPVVYSLALELTVQRPGRPG